MEKAFSDRVREQVPKPPIAELVGMRPLSFGAGESFTTLELKINFLRPVFEAKLTASARVVQRGRTIGLVECDVTNGEGKPVARASSTCSVLRGDDAKGR